MAGWNKRDVYLVFTIHSTLVLTTAAAQPWAYCLVMLLLAWGCLNEMTEKIKINQSFKRKVKEELFI